MIDRTIARQTVLAVDLGLITEAFWEGRRDGVGGDQWSMNLGGVRVSV